MAPDTDCPLCWHTEATRLQRAARKLADAADPNRGTLAILASIGATYAVLLGHRPASWYERHRAAFIESGNLAELRRMLRHVRLA